MEMQFQSISTMPQYAHCSLHAARQVQTCPALSCAEGLRVYALHTMATRTPQDPAPDALTLHSGSLSKQLAGQAFN